MCHPPCLTSTNPLPCVMPACGLLLSLSAGLCQAAQRHRLAALGAIGSWQVLCCCAASVLPLCPLFGVCAGHAWHVTHSLDTRLVRKPHCAATRYRNTVLPLCLLSGCCVQHPALQGTPWLEHRSRKTDGRAATCCRNTLPRSCLWPAAWQRRTASPGPPSLWHLLCRHSSVTLQRANQVSRKRPAFMTLLQWHHTPSTLCFPAAVP